MSASCAAPITWEELVAYWADDLEPAEVDRIDEHVMGCEVCTAASTRAAAISAALRAVIPPFLDRARLESLRARGHRIRENLIHADQRVPITFPADVDLLIHRLTGLDLANAESVGVVITVEETGDVLIVEPRLPFDREAGEVLIACQVHFAAFPPNIVLEVRTRETSGVERTARYLIPHLFEPRA